MREIFLRLKTMAIGHKIILIGHFLSYKYDFVSYCHDFQSEKNLSDKKSVLLPCFSSREKSLTQEKCPIAWIPRGSSPIFYIVQVRGGTIFDFCDFFNFLTVSS